jgi:catalase
MFLNSQSPPERQHLVDACRFELSKVERLQIRERVIGLFQEIDADFAAEVASAVGVSLPAPKAVVTKAAAKARDGRAPVKSSPALSLVNQPRPSIKTRNVALLALPGVSLADVDAICGTLCGQGAKVEIVSRVLGALETDGDRPLDVKKTFQNTASVLHDAVVIPGGKHASELARHADALHFVRESFRHAKPIGASNEGLRLLSAAALPGIEFAGRKPKRPFANSHGVVTTTADDLGEFLRAFVEALRLHRHFDRDLTAVPA